MRYQPPVGASDSNALYVGRSLAAGGSTGSRVPAAAIEQPQREIVAAIVAAGFLPSAADLTQLAQAIRILVQQALDRTALASVLPTNDVQYRPGVVLPVGSFTRASTATWFDPTGALQTAANDVARITADPVTGANRGLLIEGSRTNYLLNSAAPATQTVSLAAGTYCLWVVGSGSATVSGATNGVAAQGAPFTFTLGSSGSVVVTVAGSLARFQLGNSSYPSSFIATTSAAATRAADVYSESSSGWFNPAEGALYVSFWFDGLSFGTRLCSLSDGTISNMLELTKSTVSFNAIVTLGGVQALAMVGSAGLVAGVNRMVFSYGPSETVLALNGAIIAAAGAAPSFSAFTTFKYARPNNAAQPDSSILRRAVFPRALSQEVAKRMTAPGVVSP